MMYMETPDLITTDAEKPGRRTCLVRRSGFLYLFFMRAAVDGGYKRIFVTLFLLIFLITSDISYFYFSNIRYC